MDEETYEFRMSLYQADVKNRERKIIEKKRQIAALNDEILYQEKRKKDTQSFINKLNQRFIETNRKDA